MAAGIDPEDGLVAAANAATFNRRRSNNMRNLITNSRRFRNLYILVSVAVVFIATANYLTSMASVSLEQTKLNEQLSFEPPTSHNDAVESVATDDSRRNLSETMIQQSPTPQLNITEIKGKAEQRYEQKIEQQQQEPNKDNQSSTNRGPSAGLVYDYIEPPPINLTARAKIPSNKFRLGLPDLTNTNNLNNTTSALCGIVKDAEAYLDEWVDYHFGLGFHSIYLIDNSDKHELKSWQDKRRNAGYSVRVLPKPGTHRQMYGYHMCAAEFKNDHTYMAFFDVDEFLVLKKHDRVDDMLADHLKEGSLAVSWYIFGTGDTNMYAPLPVTKRFMYRDGDTEKTRHNQWSNVKSILKLQDYGNYPKSPHSMKHTRGTWKDTNGGGSFDKIGAINTDRPTDVAIIHHYKYLSPKEFHWKSCVRKTVDDKFKDCNDDKELRSKPYKGHTFDDSAWALLKKNVPQYAMYDEFEDFM